MHGNVRNRTITPQEWLEVLKAGLEGKPGPQMAFTNQQGALYNMALQIVQNEQGKFEVENQYEIEKTATKAAPIHESRLRLGDLLKTKRSAGR